MYHIILTQGEGEETSCMRRTPSCSQATLTTYLRPRVKVKTASVFCHNGWVRVRVRVLNSFITMLYIIHRRIVCYLIMRARVRVRMRMRMRMTVRGVTTLIGAPKCPGLVADVCAGFSAPSLKIACSPMRPSRCVCG